MRWWHRRLQPAESLPEGAHTRLARSVDVGRRVLACRVEQAGGEQTVLVWRTRSGRPIAMDARCPHRNLPMTGGRLVGDSIECPFHRHRFAPSGRCVNRRDVRPATVLTVHEADGQLWLA